MKSVKIFVLSIVVCLITIAQQGKAFGQEAVDLGLPSGTLWASCNVGAANEWESGNIFKWAETTPQVKQVETWPPHKYYSDDRGLTKYCTKEQFGHNRFTDNRVILEPMDDAATVNMGVVWWMPTREDFQELIGYCISEWTNNYDGHGTAGRIFRNRTNPEIHIFLPNGNYWSSSLDADISRSPDQAWFLSSKSNEILTLYRKNAYAVRAVRAPAGKTQEDLRIQSYEYAAKMDREAISKPYVDLGLPSGTKWATFNVGAASPLDNGDYFAWGDVKAKTEKIYLSDYKFANGGKFSKYNSVKKFGVKGFVDNITVIQFDDDAATANMGKSWRMPTLEEWQELRAHCTWQWTDNYMDLGKAGYRIISNKNPDSRIFLPAAGGYCGICMNAPKTNYYWSSSLNAEIPSEAYCIYFSGKDLQLPYEDYRYAIKPIRAVLSGDTTNCVVVNNNVTDTKSVSNYDAAAEKSKFDNLINRYNAQHSTVEAEVKQYEDDINTIYKAYHSNIGWNGKSTVVITEQDNQRIFNDALAIAKKTIDPRQIERLDKAYKKFCSTLDRGYSDGTFSEAVYKQVYTAVAKNSESLDFEIFYFKAMYPVLKKYYVDNSLINRLIATIPRTTDRDRQAELYTKYVEVCNMTNKNANTSLSTPMCQSFVEEINRTRSSQATALCDNYTKTWPNYQSDIYLPTEEVRLYNRLKDLEAKKSNELFKTIDLYLQKYSNSGYDVSELIFKNFENLSVQESSEAVITMILSHQNYINQYTDYDTRLNDLLYGRLSGLDPEKSVRAMYNLINGNPAYMQTHAAYDANIQALYLSKLAEFDEGKRNEHILHAISDNKKYADKLKSEFNTIENAYTWIKANSSANYYWTGIIDKYQTCFPTSTHKTELSNLRSSLAESIRQREEAERRRQEEERRARESRYASNSSSNTDLNKMNENQLADWWRSHKGTKISFEYEDYFSECDGWIKRNYKFIGYVDECQWSEFYVNIISISMLSSGFTTKENDDEVTSCVKRKYIGNHIRIYPSRIYKLTEE
ncbi:MAG: hypothetical protein II852_11815 [Bacteroidales bacterium]|nr:hypothetical protein [Bacteroidales bacterium]